mmetsp:Transcript_110201/g.351225  ORF Transcript_110201/g.351225 Transcript_110201/m.351225 type:complete len:222 (-) Transcript_110201:16-681(-)
MPYDSPRSTFCRIALRHHVASPSSSKPPQSPSESAGVTAAKTRLPSSSLHGVLLANGYFAASGRHGTPGLELLEVYLGLQAMGLGRSGSCGGVHTTAATTAAISKRPATARAGATLALSGGMAAARKASSALSAKPGRVVPFPSESEKLKNDSEANPSKKMTRPRHTKHGFGSRANNPKLELLLKRRGMAPGSHACARSRATSKGAAARKREPPASAAVGH